LFFFLLKLGLLIELLGVVKRFRWIPFGIIEGALKLSNVEIVFVFHIEISPVIDRGNL